MKGKVREYSKEERAAVNICRRQDTRLAEVARKVGCNKSAEHLIFKRFGKTGSIKENARVGWPKKNSEWEESAIYRAPSQLRLSTLSEIKTTVVDHFSKWKPNLWIQKFW